MGNSFSGLHIKMNNNSSSSLRTTRSGNDNKLFGDLFNKTSSTDWQWVIDANQSVMAILYGSALYVADYKWIGGCMAATGITGYVINYM